MTTGRINQVASPLLRVGTGRRWNSGRAGRWQSPWGSRDVGVLYPGSAPWTVRSPPFSGRLRWEELGRRTPGSPGTYRQRGRRRAVPGLEVPTHARLGTRCESYWAPGLAPFGLDLFEAAAHQSPGRGLPIHWGIEFPAGGVRSVDNYEGPGQRGWERTGIGTDSSGHGILGGEWDTMLSSQARPPSWDPLPTPSRPGDTGSGP